MGYEELSGIKQVSLKNLWAGWFPNVNHNAVPGDLNTPDAPVGAADCNNVIYVDGALRKIFGYTVITSSALNGTPTSLFYSPVLSNLVGTAGVKIYSSMDAASPSDITGAISVTTALQVHWTEWQFETTKYVIGTNGTDAPWKWTGTGNASALGGSPPSGRWIATFQNAVWLANTSTEPSTLFFSNTGDPETWTTDDDYKFDAPITGLGKLGDLLVVFMEDHIGVLSGTNNRQLVKVDRYINGKGCSGGHTVVNGNLAGKEVLIFHSGDGFYAFDGTQTLIKLSTPIARKYTNSSSTSRWNEQRFNKAWATYDNSRNWYICALSDGGDSKNDFILILDLGRFFETADGTAVPHWPLDAVDANCVAVSKISSLNTLCFGSTDALVYKFSPGTFTRNGSAYTAYYRSKTFDTVESFIIQEVNIFSDEVGTSTTLDVFINANLSSGDGNSGSSNFQSTSDLLDSTFILDSSSLGGKEFVLKNVQVTDWGRFARFKLRNTGSGQQMVIYGVDFVLQSLGLESNVGN